MEVQLEVTPEQQEMLECEDPFQVWAIGRRWGKTLTGRHKLVREGLKYPGMMFYYLSLSYSKSKTEYRRFWQGCKELVQWKSLQPHPEVQWFNGSQFRFLSMDRPENILGEGVKLIFLDEAARMDPEPIWEVLQPMTADVDGKMIFCSTFYGNNWFYDEYMKGCDPANKGEYRSFLYTTPTGIAFQDAEGKKRLERIKRRIPTIVWDQEYMCVPTVGANAVFRGLERVIKDLPILAERQPGRSYIVSWDTGKKVNPSAVVVMDDTGRVVYFEVIPLMTEEDEQLRFVVELVKRFQATLVIDSTGAGTRDWVVGFARKRLTTAVHSLYMHQDDKEAMVRETCVCIENATIAIPSVYNVLITQLRNYTYELKGKRYEYGAPPGQLDDGVAALMMACWARKMKLIRPPPSYSGGY